MARPTDYSQEILDKARAYLELGYAEDEKIPSIAGLSRFLGVARSTIYEWGCQEDKKEFSDILEQVLAKQEYTLINKGLNNEFNSTITKLVLAKQGYSDKTETDVTSKGNRVEAAVINIINPNGETGGNIQADQETV
jgi:uncharacterized protein YdaT